MTEVMSVSQTLHEEALVHLLSLQTHRIELGLTLLQIRQYDSHKELGFDSFEEYTAAPLSSGGLGLHHRTRQAIMQIADVYVNSMGVPVKDLRMIPWTNLQEVVSVVSPDNVEVVLADAGTLGGKDLRKNKQEGKYTGVVLALDPAREPEMKREEPCITCPNCGAKIQL